MNGLAQLSLLLLLPGLIAFTETKAPVQPAVHIIVNPTTLPPTPMAVPIIVVPTTQLPTPIAIHVIAAAPEQPQMHIPITTERAIDVAGINDAERKLDMYLLARTGHIGTSHHARTLARTHQSRTRPRARAPTRGYKHNTQYIQHQGTPRHTTAHHGTRGTRTSTHEHVRAHGCAQGLGSARRSVRGDQGSGAAGRPHHR